MAPERLVRKRSETIPFPVFQARYGCVFLVRTRTGRGTGERAIFAEDWASLTRLAGCNGVASELVWRCLRFHHTSKAEVVGSGTDLTFASRAYDGAGHV